MRNVPLLCAATIVLTVLLGCHQRRDSAGGNRESRAASELYREFETVVCSKPQLLSPTASNTMHLSQAETNNLRYPFAYLQGALGDLGSGAHVSILASSEAVLVGAKDFLPPKGLGSVRSHRCYVVVLGRQSTFELRKYFTSAPIASAAGVSVWSWEAALGEFGEADPKASTLYGSQCGQSYVLVSNDLHELVTLAERLSLSSKGIQSASVIPKWEVLSQHEEWAYRKYRRAGIVNADAAGMTDVTPSADALVFFIDSDNRSGILQLIASDKGTAEHINARFAIAKVEWPPLKSPGAGLWETTIPFSGDEASADRLFVVVGLFGFPVYL
jgi:hypothetical protein